jgi:hypothetical protein
MIIVHPAGNEVFELRRTALRVRQAKPLRERHGLESTKHTRRLPAHRRYELIDESRKILTCIGDSVCKPDRDRLGATDDS